MPGQSGPGSNGNEGVFCIPQSPSITRSSPSDCLVSYPGHSWVGWGERVLPLCKGAVSVFYSPSWLGNIIWKTMFLELRYKRDQVYLRLEFSTFLNQMARELFLSFFFQMTLSKHYSTESKAQYPYKAEMSSFPTPFSSILITYCIYPGK